MFHRFATSRIGATDVEVTRLGLGAGYICGWPVEQPDEIGLATVQRALDRGIRYVDTAPFYGNGRAEALVGEALAGLPRESFALSTKVGRLLVPERPPASAGDAEPPLAPVFDFSADGVERSLQESDARLGQISVDIALIHDPDDHHAEAVALAYPTLVRAKSEGRVRAIGVAMNWSEPLARFARELDVDCLLLAGRYTLFEQDSLDDLMPVASERGISIIAGGVYNSGLLVNPARGATYNYAPAGADVLERAQRLGAACREFDVPLRSAALQFPLAHPAVACVLAGASNPSEVDDNVEMLRTPIPAELWQSLQDQGLIRADAPVPA